MLNNGLSGVIERIYIVIYNQQQKINSLIAIALSPLERIASASSYSYCLDISCLATSCLAINI